MNIEDQKELNERTAAVRDHATAIAKVARRLLDQGDAVAARAVARQADLMTMAMAPIPANEIAGEVLRLASDEKEEAVFVQWMRANSTRNTRVTA